MIQYCKIIKPQALVVEFSTSTNANWTFTNTSIVSNEASGSGGGIYSTSTSSNFEFVDSNVSSNKATGGSGGGIYSSNTSNANWTFTNTSISNNETSGSGGGIYSTSTNANWTFTNTSIVSNEASGSGGGIYSTSTSSNFEFVNSSVSSNISSRSGGGIYSTSTNANFKFVSSYILSNKANGGSGGGIYSSSASSNFEFVNSNVSSNISSGSGGGIYSTSTNANFKFVNSYILSNKANGGSGGGIYSSSNQLSDITIEASNVKYNTATGGSGGGIYSSGINSSLKFIYSHIVSNTATSHGGGIYSSGSTSSIISIKNGSGRSLVQGNIASSSGGAIYSDSYRRSEITISGSDVKNNTATSGSGGAIYNYVSTGNYVYSSSVAATAIVNILNHSTMTGNTATSGSGGTIYNYAYSSNDFNNGSSNIYSTSNATVTVTDSDIIGGIAGIHGGAIYNYAYAYSYSSYSHDTGICHPNTLGYTRPTPSIGTANATISLTNSTIYDSEANVGGGIYNYATGNNRANSYVQIQNSNIMRNKATDGQGGGVYNVANIDTTSHRIVATNANILVQYSTISQNTSTSHGAGIYNYSYAKNIYELHTGDLDKGATAQYTYATAKTNVRIENSTISNNEILTSGAGAGLYNYAYSYTENTGWRLEHKTWKDIYGEWHHYHHQYNANYAEGETVNHIYIVNSTLTGNVATQNGAAIYNYATSEYSTVSKWKYGGTAYSSNTGESKLYFVNSIVYGNYTGTVGYDVAFAGNRSQTLYTAYSIFGYSNVLPDSSTMRETWQLNTNATNIRRIFKDVNIDVAGRAIAQLTSHNVVDMTNYTIALNETGDAAIKGTLVGKIGDDYYFYNRQNGYWHSLTAGSGNVFNATAENYNLGASSILYLDAENYVAGNLSSQRMQRNYSMLVNSPISYFNVGAYALASTTTKPYEKASLVVTTTNDVINIYDGKTSLREALAFAANLGEDAVITFADHLFGDNTNITINLVDKYQELRMTNALHNHSITIDGGVDANNPNIRRNVYIDALRNTHNYRVLQVGSSYETSTNWNIHLKNVTLRNGIAKDDPSSINGHYSLDQNGHGGLIYLRGASISLNLEHVGLSGAKADGNGGAIYSQAISTRSAITMLNTTIHGNQAVQGGAIYNYASADSARLVIVDSTITANIATTSGGAIVNYGNSSSAIYLVNSIVYGNYVNTDAQDIHFENNRGTLYVVYSILGKSNVQPYSSNMMEDFSLKTNETNMKRIFQNVMQDSSNRWIAQLEYSENNTVQTVAINHQGEAAIRGTLVGKINNDFYYYNMNTGRWTSLTNSTTYLFNENNTDNYGLTGGTIIKQAHNAFVVNPDPRINSLYFFNVGSHALIQDATHIYEVPSIHVTTDDDIIDIYDGKISLREAIYYAANGVTSTIAGLENTYTVTFDDDLANNENGQTNTITLSDTYQEMRITKGLHDKQLSINANYNDNGVPVGEGRRITIKVANVGETEYRIFQAGSSYDSHSIWKIDLQNLDIYGGSISAHSNYSPWDQAGQGGILYIKGGTNTVNLNYVTMQSTKSTGSGAAIYSSASNNGIITLTRSTIEKNDSQSGGGAIYSTASNSTITLTNSTMKENTSQSSGGAIYSTASNSIITLTNSTMNENTSQSSGGAIYSTASNNSTISLTNSTMKENASQSNGGAIYNNASYSTITLTSSTMKENDSQSSGGAIYNYASQSASTTLQSNSILSNNIATSSGGGIYNESRTSTVTIRNSEISNNIVSTTSNTVSGGGVYNYGSSSSTVNLNNAKIRGNKAISQNSNAYGGGVYNYGGSTATVNVDNKTLFHANEAIASNTNAGKAYGGGIHNQSSVTGYINITNDSVFSSNKALGHEGYGGAVANYVFGSSTTSTGMITGYDSLIKNNEATSDGGGLYNYVYNGAYGTSSNAVATISLDEVTVSKNKAGSYGGGIYNYGETSGSNSGNNTSTTNATITLVNSTISRNEASMVVV